MSKGPDAPKDEASFLAAKAERAKANKAVADLAADLAKVAAAVKKAKGEADTAKKELAGESDELS